MRHIQRVPHTLYHSRRERPVTLRIVVAVRRSIGLEIGIAGPVLRRDVASLGFPRAGRIGGPRVEERVGVVQRRAATASAFSAATQAVQDVPPLV
jgi:hypothetical protein